MMRRLARFLPVVLAACAHKGGAPASGPQRAEVTLSAPELVHVGSAAMATWVLYGGTRAVLYEKQPVTARNRSADDFALELEARHTMTEFWAKQRATADKPNAYLDLMVDLRQAGFLDEYLLVHLSKPGWTVPADALAGVDVAAFERWATSRLADHQPVVPVTVRPMGGPELPPVPGEGLPDPAALAPRGAPCANTAAVEAALAAWAREAAALEVVPLSAHSRAEFARAVDRARGQPESRTRGVTWVSPVPAELHFLRGFCAVERHDHATALEALGQSLRLDPSSPSSRLELSHVLVQMRQLDEADRQIDGVLATSKDRCQLGRAYRQRGFILVERGRLEDAYAAYQQSLAHEPGSQLAIKEMLFIAGEIQRQGGAAARAFKPYQPPATPSQVVTECADR